MSIRVKKRNLIMSGLVLLLGGAVFANWYFVGDGSKITQKSVINDVSQEANVNLGDARYVNSDSSSNQFFANAKINRDEAYDKSVEALKEIINNENSDDAAVKTASASLTDISDNRLIESNIETSVSAKIGGECVCVINNDSVEVIIDEKYLTDNSVLQIKDIINANTDVKLENISIIPAKN